MPNDEASLSQEGKQKKYGRRYQRIFVNYWQDDKIRQISEDARFLFLYILTSPHSNSLGLYCLPMLYIMSDLEWKDKRLNKAFKELLEKGLIKYDKDNRLIFIRNHLKHNPIENPNQVLANIKIASLLPKSPLFNDVIAVLKEQNKPFHIPLLNQLHKQLAHDLNEKIIKA